MKLKSIIALVLCFSSLLGLIACDGGDVPAETTAEDAITTDFETTIEESTEMEEINKTV